MILHLIYKEWIKTRWFALVALVAGLAAVVGIFAGVAGGIRDDAPFYLSRLLTNKEVFFALFRFVSLFAAVLIGVSQFLPEVVDKRIKLSLHLPLGPVRVVYSMVLYGFLLLSAILTCCLLLFVGLTAVYLPAEVIRAALVTMMPWVLGGMTAYFWIAMIAMEPVGKFRFFYFIVAYLLISVFMRKFAVGNVETLLPVLAALTGVSSVSVLFTARRFNKGEL